MAEAHFPSSKSYKTSDERIIALKSSPLAIRGILLPSKTISKTLFDLGNIFSWPKYGNTPAAANKFILGRVGLSWRIGEV